MVSKQQKNSIKKLVLGDVFFDEPMRKHTSFRIGGPADVLIKPRNVDDLKNIVKFTHENNIPFSVMGNGTNLLVSDNGVRGAIIKISDCLNALTIDGTKVIAGAGILLPKLSNLVAEQGLQGLEFAVGIPGTVGGAVVLNAGAHKNEISNVVTKVMVMNSEGDISYLTKKDLRFGPRMSELRNRNDIVINVEMELTRGRREDIKEKMYKYLQWRKDNQPLKMPNAGSIFLNPKGNYAGRLIEMCGCKGLKVGDAQVSNIHANFIVNLGSAKASDIMALIDIVRQKVKEAFDIELELEIEILGMAK